MPVEESQPYSGAQPSLPPAPPPPPPQGYYAVPPQSSGQYVAAAPQYPGAYAAKPPTLPITIVSMCLGIGSVTLGWLFVGFGLALGIAAVVCGHVGMKQIAKYPQSKAGKGFAVAGLATGYAGIAFGLAFLGFMIFFFAVLASAS